jgi:ribonucleoside-triphosphate reductase
MPSARADILTRRTYCRPLDEEGKVFENWNDVVNRVISHQLWLWERAKNASLNTAELKELEEFKQLLLDRKVSVSGRTLWLGGTDISKTREASQFNCSFTEVETVYDLVDVLWLLLNGCGVGVKPVIGTLTGFRNPIETLEIIRSKRTERGGIEHNIETWDSNTKTWTIKVGDSAEAWAKSIGKLCAGKYPAKTLVLDFSELRPAGIRLKGYGWISSGDGALCKAYSAIFNILNSKSDNLLTKIDIMDIVNWLGTILSSRRSAEIVLFEYGEPEWKEFALAKKDMYDLGLKQREQSNNSLVFRKKPTREQLNEIFAIMQDGGGSEPGFINAEAALKRAPWWFGMNPCCEILLGNKSFCNLTEVDISQFKNNNSELRKAVELSARANYRQTCVDLRDGILQEAWHLNNDFLRLCGVGLTGIIKRADLSHYDYKFLNRIATSAAHSMAKELELPMPKNVCCIKPSGRTKID